jgi:dephospho-CoA kinase
MAMGKSTASKMLAGMDGVAVQCSDEAVKELYEDERVIDVIKATFPAAYDKKHKTIDKKKLMEELDHDHEKWDALEEILHPLVREKQKQFIQKQTTLGTKIVILDIPLLFETGAETRLDYTITVSAPEFIQWQRIEQRLKSGVLTEDDAAFRLSRQMSDAEKRKRSDYIVASGQGLAYMRKELEKIIKQTKERHFKNGPQDCSLSPHNLG